MHDTPTPSPALTQAERAQQFAAAEKRLFELLIGRSLSVDGKYGPCIAELVSISEVRSQTLGVIKYLDGTSETLGIGNVGVHLESGPWGAVVSELASWQARAEKAEADVAALVESGQHIVAQVEAAVREFMADNGPRDTEAFGVQVKALRIDCGRLERAIAAAWMVTCDTCGCKRCPHATHHVHACTGSNEPGQKGSSWEDYPSAKSVASAPSVAVAEGMPEAEVKP